MEEKQIKKSATHSGEVPRIRAYSVKQIGQTGIASVRQLWREIETGRLESFRVGTRVRVTEDALNRYIEHNTRRATTLDARSVAVEMLRR